MTAHKEELQELQSSPDLISKSQPDYAVTQPKDITDIVICTWVFRLFSLVCMQVL